MSYIISGLNIQNISEYNSGSSYVKYDIVDFELNTGISLYPSYTGLGNSGLYLWVNNDVLTDFQLDSNFRVSGWINKVDYSGNLVTYSTNTYDKTFVDFNENYIRLKPNQFLSGSGYNKSTRTVFVAVEVESFQQNISQEIFRFGDSGSYGFLQVSGLDSYGSSKVYVDNSGFNAVSNIYGDLNIFTLTQEASDLKVRQNGIDIGTVSSYNSAWTGSNFRIGPVTDSSNGIKYYEIVQFTGNVSSSDIEKYEKYLFEKYSTRDGLYFAKNNVASGISYSPITYTGANYWTRDLDDIFNLTYGCSANFSAKLSPLYMGDGYKTNTINGINTLQTEFDLHFDGLTDIQAKSLITFFENSPEAQNKSLYEGFKGVEMNLFYPYKKNAEIYFKTIDHSSSYADLNKISIKGESLFESNLNYKGMFVELDEVNVKTYSDFLTSIQYNDVFYYPSVTFSERGYYFYTGANINASSGPSGPSGPINQIYIAPENSPTGASSYFTKNFYFKPDLDYSINSQVRLFTNDLKNSTKEYEKDGINYNNLEFQLNFTKRSDKEALAILKFLEDKAGYKVFNYTLPQPYNKNISVYCPEWNHDYNFKDNHSISAKFIQFRNNFDQASNFNTVVTFVS